MQSIVISDFNFPTKNLGSQIYSNNGINSGKYWGAGSPSKLLEGPLPGVGGEK